MDESHCLCARDGVVSEPVRRPNPWLHYGVTPAPGRRAAWLHELRETAVEVLAGGLATDFFFLHKPPGLRVRFAAEGAARPRLAELLAERFAEWRRDGRVTAWRSGVYEPEEYLFGGPVSMRSVHRVFTADSLAWLGYHASTPAPAPAGQPAAAAGHPGPAWAMSLLMARALLDSLAIVGWEDLDVWDRLRWQAGRRLGGTRPAGIDRITAALRSGWAAPQRLSTLLSPGARDLIAEHRTALAAIGAQWMDSYFTTGDPAIGPREAAAFVTVFQFNRAGLSPFFQSIIAEALTARPGQAAS